MEFDSCLGKVGELLGKRPCQGKLFIVNIIFGATPVFSVIFLKVHFFGSFHGITVSMHDTCNCTAKCCENVGISRS